MNTLAIVIISLFAGLLLALLIASAVYLAWMQHKLRQFIESSAERNRIGYEDAFQRLTQAGAQLSHTLQAVIDHHSKSIEAARHELNLLSQTIRATLESHYAKTEAAVAKINGDKLAEYSEIAIQAARRIETAAVALGEFYRAITGEEETGIRRAAESGLAPESYAPASPGERFTSLGRTAAADRQIAIEEGVENPEG